MTQGNVFMGRTHKNWNNNAKIISFCITENCNLSCKYCYIKNKNENNKLSSEAAKKAVDFVLSNNANLDYEAVIWEFIGGEPFLEIDLIDEISDYIKYQMYSLNHPWFKAYKFSVSTNGTLYHKPNVQRYIWKNNSHISICFNMDGIKIPHSHKRTSSIETELYNNVIRNVPLWLKQFPKSTVKVTFQSNNLSLLKNSIIFIWNLGIKIISTNIVFEDSWHEEDQKIFEAQLIQLADYILDNELYYHYSVKFFDPSLGNPIKDGNQNKNILHPDKILSIDYTGKILSDSSSFKHLSRKECLSCEIATGCYWINNYNKYVADIDRSLLNKSHICNMHKANVLANKYFWHKFERKTGLSSERKSKTSINVNTHIKYMYLITNDDMVPHCSYKISKSSYDIMSQTTFEKCFEYCAKYNFVPIILGRNNTLYKNNLTLDYVVLSDIDETDEESITIYNNNIDRINKKSQITNCILLIDINNIKNISSFVYILNSIHNRINIVLQDINLWGETQIELYKSQLNELSNTIIGQYSNNKFIEINIITDLWNSNNMYNCDAGEESFCIAPNGKIYYCPAFYYDNPDNIIGSLDSEINLKIPQLNKLQNAKCKNCDIYSCKHCKYENFKITGDINVPSRIQCLISHEEKGASQRIQQKLLNISKYCFVNILK